MASKPNGIVTFEALGERWSLRFGINAMVEVEEAFDGKGIVEVGREILAAGDAVRVRDMRTLFRCALADDHPSMTDAEAGRIMTDVGAERAAELIGESLFAAFPQAAESGPVPPINRADRRKAAAEKPKPKKPRPPRK